MPIEPIIYSVGAVWGFMTLNYFIGLIKKDNSIVDIAWGGGFIVVATVSLLAANKVYNLQLLVAVLVALWGGRLAVYIWIRKRSKPEDWRYQKWRQDWGKNLWWRAYLQIYMLQGLFMLLISAPIIMASMRPTNILEGYWLAGLILWMIGYFFEVVGDYQMYAFKSDPQNKGKIMNRGLWRYTRHPNYFGETLMWWGIYIIVLEVTGGWITIFSPILITFLLLRVSGVTMLESKYKDNPEYQKYVENTNAFFPWFPKAND